MTYSEIFLLSADTNIQSTYEYMSVETHPDAIDVGLVWVDVFSFVIFQRKSFTYYSCIIFFAQCLE